MTNMTGFLTCSNFDSTEFGLKQIYSPSRLYSMMLPKEINKPLRLSEFFLLNNASLEVHKYSMEQETKDIKMNALYWLIDCVLVGVFQQENILVQTIFLVDHEKKVIVKDKERRHILNPGRPSEHYKNNFTEQLPMVTLEGKEFITWLGDFDANVGGFWIFLLPRNPLLDVEVKEFSIKVGSGSRALAELVDLFQFGAGTLVSIDFPAFSHKSRLLCRIGVTESRERPVSDIFGVFVCYDIENFVDLHGKVEYDRVDVEVIQDRLTTLIFLPKPRSMRFTDFYCFIKCNSATGENKILMKRTLSDASTLEMCLINFDTFEHHTIVAEKERFDRFSVHPDGFAMLWKQTEDRIQFKKVFLPLRSNTLKDLTRRQLILSGMFNPLTVLGLKPILFPGSNLIFKINK